VIHLENLESKPNDVLSDTQSDWKNTLKNILKTIGKSIWWAVKSSVKGLIWAGKKWWDYIDTIASVDPKDFQKPAKTSSISHNLKVTTIDGVKHYKTKDGSYKKLDV